MAWIEVKYYDGRKRLIVNTKNITALEGTESTNSIESYIHTYNTKFIVQESIESVLKKIDYAETLDEKPNA